MTGVMDRYTKFGEEVDWFLFGGEGWAASVGWYEAVWVWDVGSIMGSRYNSPGGIGLGRESIIMCLKGYHNFSACYKIRRPGLLPKKPRLLYTGTVCCNGLAIRVETLRLDKLPVIYPIKSSLLSCRWSAIYSSKVSNQCMTKPSG